MLPLFFCLLVFLSSCGDQQQHHVFPPTEVTTFLVERKNIPLEVDNVGVALSSHQVEIRSQVQGYLEKVTYKEGQIVKSGDLLFQIDPRPFQASLDIAKGELARQEALLWDATRSVGRLEPLYKEKAASQRDYETALAQKIASEAAVESAKANVRQAELNLEYTTIKSPITGLADTSKSRQGALISPNSLLTTVSVLDPIWVQFSLSESDVLKFSREIAKHRLTLPEDNQYEIEVTFADGTKFPHKGKLHFTSPTYEPSTGTLMIQATLPNPDEILLPGQFVRVKMVGGFWNQAIAVPQKSVQQSKRGTFVYVVNKENQAEIRYIDPGEWYQNLWIIEKGLEPGDQVIVEGVNKVGPGSPVKIEDKETKL